MSLKKQSGMSALLLLFILSTGGFLIFCLIKLGPVYSENNHVRNALKTLARNHADSLGGLSNTVIRQELSKYYTINNVRGEATKALEVERLQGRTLISVNYEVRIPLVVNIDAVLKFNNVLDSSRPDECCNVSEDK